MSCQRIPAIVFGLLIAAGLACAGSGSNTDATATAIVAALNATATAQVTAEEDAGGSLQTAAANLTAVAERSAATLAAEAHAAGQSEAGTATAVAPILGALATYGVDSTQGRVAWVHPPIAIDIEGYLQYDYANQYLGTVAQDFVASADITWNTFTGLSGCGYAVRSDGNEDDFTGYLVVATRGATGHVGFFVVQENEIVDQLDIYARGQDRSFQWQNDTTNRLAVVGQGDTFTFFTNGVQIGTFTAPPDYYYEKGFVAMVALSESGLTHCQFDNAWLWLIE